VGVFGEFFFWFLGWSAFTSLSTTWAIYGVSRALSTEKKKAAQTVEKPVHKPTWQCAICGGDEWNLISDGLPRRRL